jgi:hypothetical protein
MHSKLTLLLTAMILLLTVGVIGAAPVAAAPKAPGPYAEPFKESACQMVGDGLERCYQYKGVILEDDVDSDPTPTHSKFIVNHQLCEQYYLNGELAYEGCHKDHIQILYSLNSENYVYHPHYTMQYFVYMGINWECTTTLNYIVANSELRHDDFQTTCDTWPI